MASFNSVFLIGNCTRSPDRKQTQGGVDIATFGMAINNKWKDKSGQIHEEVVFVDVTAWSGLANTAATYLKKGSCCFVQGHLKLDQWQDKTTNQKRSKLYVVAERIQFLDSKQSGGEGAPLSQSPEPASPEPHLHQPPSDDHIPF